MSKKKPNYTPRSFETMPGKKSNLFARIFTSMLTSPAFIDLPSTARNLYVACKSEYYAGKSPEGYSEEHFHMNRHLYVNKYGLYGENDSRGFKRDMARLINHGFVDCVRSGYETRSKNIYRFSDRWQNWDTPNFTVPDSVKTSYMLRIEARGRRSK